MTIKEVSETYDISADTLRYYERIGMIPEVTRTAGGIRDYQESDLGWVELVICMRKAGLPVEALIEYVKLYQEGDETFEARLQLLSEEREKLEEQKAQIESAINRLNHKISKYEEAVKTGVLCLLRTIFLETTYASCSGSTPASISNFVFLRIFGAFKASPSLSPTLPMKR